MIKRFSLMALLLFTGLVAGIVLSGTAEDRDEVLALPSTATVAEQPATAPAVATAGGQPDFTRVAAQTVKAVTNISAIQIRGRRQASPFANDPFFQYFFGDQGEMFGQPRAESSLGSGVVISADGYVVTNNHVIGEGDTEVTVTVGDHRDIRAKVVGVDSWTDLALLKIDVAGLPVIPYGDSSKLKVAEWVMAVGSPFSLSQTVT
ncbi:MAG: trypsin-like peptidase domain-containing protein, partial [Vicinamibacterales bacterium]